MIHIWDVSRDTDEIAGAFNQLWHWIRACYNHTRSPVCLADQRKDIVDKPNGGLIIWREVHISGEDKPASYLWRRRGAVRDAYAVRQYVSAVRNLADSIERVFIYVRDDDVRV